MEQRRNLISLSELEYGPLKFSFRRVRLQLTKWVGIIAIKTEKTQIHFLSDVLVAVAPLDLKVPNPINARAPSLGPRLSLFSEVSYRAFSHDVIAAVYQDNPVGVELFSHVNDVNAFFCSIE